VKEPDRPVAYWLRWFCLPPALFAIFLFLGLALAFLNSFLRLWFEPAAGFILALVWVLSAHLIAPDRKPIASAMAFGIGTMLAWQFIGDSWYPENHPKAYQPTHLPIMVTIAGGVLGFAGSITMEMMKRKPKAYNATPHSGPCRGSSAPKFTDC
jgi:hypothetical protein